MTPSFKGSSKGSLRCFSEESQHSPTGPEKGERRRSLWDQGEGEAEHRGVLFQRPLPWPL